MKSFSTAVLRNFICTGIVCALFVPAYAADDDSAIDLPNLTKTWTARDGSSSVEATAEALNDKEVTLRRVDNKKTVTVSLDKLTEEDLKWIKENEIYIGKTEKELKKLINDTVVGRELKEKTQKLDGDKWVKKLAKLSARYFIAYYSASWCGPCRASMPHSVEVYNNRISQIPGLELVWCSADRKEEAALDWAKKENMPWPALLPGTRSKAFEKAKPSGYPNLFLVDDKGNVILKGGIDSLVNKAEELLKEGK